MGKRVNAYGSIAGGKKTKATVYIPWQSNGMVPKNIIDGSVRSAFVYVCGLCSNYFQHEKLPKVVMKHQLYSVMASRTEVDQGISKLRESGDIKLFKTSLGQDQYCVMFTTDYIEYVQTKFASSKSDANNDDIKLPAMPKCMTKFLSEIVHNTHSVSIDKSCLITENNFKDSDITELVKFGVLTVKNAGSWWLSIPNVGQFLKHLRKGRQGLVQVIRRTKYKELSCTELKSRKAPASVKLGVEYHIHDLVGADLLTCRESTTGVLLRIAND
uniref:Serine/threonine-protein kinase 19-like n=1 Tax=Phallusia mammillata TaxID=59560 RepID=A0A6F9DUG0_9ASCI|nr:serine/threonine-protein kinase 19-like [Phallusia mammillata]